MGDVLELGILGPFEVRLDAGPPLALGGRRQRSLLALLALRANEVISVDRIVDELWGEHAPATAVHTVQVFVSRLRAVLGGAASRLVTRAPGYALEVRVDELDADRCQRLCAGARSELASGRAAQAAVLLREAAALWRGPPLAEFAYESFAQTAIARLEELRLGCREELIEAELALGGHANVVAELEALIREQPLRERPRGQLMLALYRCGRQADALEIFQQGRRLLIEELGMEPSGALRTLEAAILRQDASLEAPAAAASTSARDVSPPNVHPAAATPAEQAVPAATGPPIVRKTTTVLAARFAITGQADPELARTTIAKAQAEAERVIRYHGGTFIRGLGGEVVGVFGLPLTREDDVHRALRAAVDLPERVAKLCADVPCQIVTRAATDTGEVVGESPDDLFGAPLTGAVALTQSAQAGDVLLSPSTLRLASPIVRAEPVADGSSWRLVSFDADGPSRQEPPASPMIGRSSELAAARAAFSRATGGRCAELLTVLGEPGMGKSRLAQEIADDLGDEATLLVGRCLSYGEGIAFWPLREALTRAAGDDSREAIRGLIDDAHDAELVADVVAAALGLATNPTRGEQVLWAFRRMLEAVAAKRPVQLVIEDAHWAEPALLDLLEDLVDWVKAPLLILCTARPELLDVRPSWGGGHPRVSSIVLGPLDEQEAQALLQQHVRDGQLSPGQRAKILQAGEGNPLFLEQLLAVSADDPWWDIDREIPATIQALLAARLDRLGPGERAFIERAAIMGREFWPSAVVELLPAEARASAQRHLRALVRIGLIEPDRSTLPGEEALRFHHILARDVAYRSTPKALRSELHELFADWLTRRGEGYDEFVGFHLEQAFKYRVELGHRGADSLELAARAADSLAVAGHRAGARGDTNAAIKLLRSSTNLVAASGHERPDVLLDLGSGLTELGDPEAEHVLEAALTQAQAVGADTIASRARIELSYWRSRMDPRIDTAEMLKTARDAIETFKLARDERGLSRAGLHIAWVHWFRSRCGEMEAALEEALEHAERAGERQEISRILRDLARAAVIGPRPVKDGMARCMAVLDRSHGDVTTVAFTQAMLAVLEAMDGQYDTARQRWKATKDRFSDVGLDFMVTAVQMYYAFIELLAGSPGRAEEDVVASCEGFERMGDQARVSSAAALVARLLYAQGRYDECGHYCRKSERSAAGDDVVSRVIALGTQAKLTARAGEASEALRLADAGVRLASATDFLMLRGDALSDRAEVHIILERAAKASDDLEEAIRLYERKGVRPSARAARKLRTSLASSPVF